MTKPPFVPLADRILVEPVDEPRDPSARIVIPENAKDIPTTGIVRAVGSGLRLSDGKIIPFEVQAGDKVLFNKYAGTLIRSEPNDYKLLQRDEILAVFTV